jgi:hypothetical protein
VRSNTIASEHLCFLSFDKYLSDNECNGNILSSSVILSRVSFRLSRKSGTLWKVYQQFMLYLQTTAKDIETQGLQRGREE